MAGKQTTGDALVETEPMHDALAALVAAMRGDARLRHDLELACQRLQRHTRGPLTDFLAAVVGETTG